MEYTISRFLIAVAHCATDSTKAAALGAELQATPKPSSTIYCILRSSFSNFSPPKIFKGVPALPTYEDATKRGMYCIIRESDITAPPPYQYRVPDDDCDDDEAGPLSGGANGASHEAAVFASISSWDFDAYGVHRGSVNSMPEFSSIFGPPDSPYPGDVSSH
ncbi:unnamed protein product [Mesocestoides corti]|uniref:Secreted protein n=1 Tax=Mesocestoides corti TaxID=53468 RepID=A0A0R3U192_MESCO|nr:unnamed protein product [Mesocestoides corti]